LLFINHPDFVSVSTSDQSIYVYDLPDGGEIVDLMLVVSLRYRDTAATGSKRR
jgi:hypothetical protein